VSNSKLNIKENQSK
jgi:hypothetical protein